MIFTISYMILIFLTGCFILCFLYSMVIKEIKKNTKESVYLKYGLITGVILNIILFLVTVIYKSNNFLISKIVVAPFIISLVLFIGVSITTVINYIYKNIKGRYQDRFLVRYISFLFILAISTSFFMKEHILVKNVFMLTFLIGLGILIIYNYIKLYFDNNYQLENINVNAKVLLSKDILKITNQDTFDWYDVELNIKLDELEDEYIYRTDLLKAGKTYEIKIEQFKNHTGQKPGVFDKTFRLFINCKLASLTTQPGYFQFIKKMSKNNV